MGYVMVLKPNQGTKIYKNSTQIQNIKFYFKDISSTSESNIMLIAGNERSFTKIDAKERNYSREIQFEQQYMVVNLSRDILELKFSLNPEDHECIYDPYLYEKEVRNDWFPKEA